MVEQIYNIFIVELYIETKYKNKSQYLIKNTTRYISCVLYEIPVY